MTVYPGSTVDVFLDVSPFDTDTDVGLDVTYLDDPVVLLTAPAPTGADNARWGAQFVATAAGEYDLTWTVTGTGAGIRPATVAVAPLPTAAPAGEVVYATTADYATWLRAAPPSGSRRALAEASRAVDEMLRTAIYDVNDDGLPTDTDVAAALRDATCAQAEYARAVLDTNSVGASGIFQSVSIGSVSLGRAGRAGAEGDKAPAPWSAKAWQILQQAGLTLHGIVRAG